MPALSIKLPRFQKAVIAIIASIAFATLFTIAFNSNALLNILHQISTMLSTNTNIDTSTANHLATLIDATIKSTKHDQLLRLFTLGCLALTFVYLIISSKKWEKKLSTMLKKDLDYEEKLKASRAHIEQRVKERTAELEEKNHQLTVTLESLKVTQEQLIHSEKLAAIGRTAHRLAQDINNPLSYMTSNMHVLNNRLDLILHLISEYQRLAMSLTDIADTTIKAQLSTLEQYREQHNIDSTLTDIKDLLNETMEGLSTIKNTVHDLTENATESED